MQNEPHPYLCVALMVLAVTLAAAGLYLMMNDHNRGGLMRDQPTPQAPPGQR